MNSRTIVALVATGMAIVGAVPVLAQQTATDTSKPAVTAQITGPASAMGQDDRDGRGRFDQDRPGRGDMRARGPIFLVGGCGDKAEERLEIAFVRLAHRLTLTTEQQPLFDAFKAAALAAQADLEKTCAANAPAGTPPDQQPAADPAAAPQPDLLALLKSGITVEEARVAAAKSVLPSFEALYASLTDAQKLALLPRGDMGRDGDMGRNNGPDGQFGGPGGKGGMMGGMKGGAPRH